MLQIRSALLLAVLSLVLAGCSARGQTFRPELLNPDQGGSKIVVYRVDQFVGGGYTASIVLDEQPMGKLKNGGFIMASVPPGRHVVEIDKSFLETGGRYPTQLFTELGQVYFVRYNQKASWANSGTGPIPLVRDGFSIVPLAEALAELQSLKESR